MPNNLTEEQRQLLREIREERTSSSRGSSLTSPSEANSSPDTTTTFDPDNDEALQSTRQFDDVVEKLPQLRASAQKYSRFNQPRPQSEPDYAIDTSAIGRAFPDFTQGGNPSDSAPDSGSASIEIGRGQTKNSTGTISQLVRASPRSSHSEASGNDSTFEFSAPIARKQPSATPSLKMPKTRNLPNEVRANPVRNNQARRPSSIRSRVNGATSPLVKTQDNGSGSSRQTSAENRQTFTAIHARIRDEMEASYISEERPPSPELTVRSSRFGGTRKQVSAQSEPLPVRFASRQSFASDVPHPQQACTQAEPLRDVPQTSNGTQQSVPTSEMPNVSELVSCVQEGAIPGFSRHTKPRTSRVASQQSSRPDPDQVDEIGVPFDEQAIVRSLKVLQDRVAELEGERAEIENFIDDLQIKNSNLEWEKAHRGSRHRSDSAIGLTDGGSDGGDEMGARRKLLIEKNRLESTVRALQSQVESSDRKAATSETALRHITEERDSAVSQLGVAYLTIEQLKVENAELARENSVLKTQLAAHTSNEDQPHQTLTEQREAEGLRHMTAQKSVQLERPMSKPEHNKPKSKRSVTEMRANLHAAATAAAQRERGQQAAPARKAAEAKDIRSRPIPTEPHVTDLFPRVEQAEKRDFSFAPSHMNDDSDQEGTQKISADPTSHGPSQWPLNHRQEDATPQETDVSYRSAEQAAHERLTKEFGRKHCNQQESAQTHTSRTDQNCLQNQISELSQQPHQDFLRKQSVQAANRNTSDQIDLTGRSFEQTIGSRNKKATAEHSRRRSEPPVPDRQSTKSMKLRNQRRHRSTENMSSASILPDDSIHQSHSNSKSEPLVSAAPQTVKNDFENQDSRSHPQPLQPNIQACKLVPVSERIPEPSEYNEEPTLRPSQSPGLALARVIRGMDDEVIKLKDQLTKANELYSAHDVSLSQRQREGLARKIQNLVEATEVKARQIYYLYDVLEGQKQAGQLVTEQELDEPTMQSIGIDPTDAAKAADSQPPDLQGIGPWDSLATAGLLDAY